MIWKEERRTNEIVEIPPDFYNRAADYLSHLETMSKTEKDPLISQLFKTRKQRVLFMLRDLLQIRIRKLISVILSSQEIPKRKLTVEELKFVSSMEKSYDNFIKEIYKLKTIDETPIIEKNKPKPEKKQFTSSDGENEKRNQLKLEKEQVAYTQIIEKSSQQINEKREEEILSEETEGIEYTYILITKEFPKQLVGIDLEIYGPFISNSVVYLPKENAVFLNRLGHASILSI